jgi:hypothetical protein
MVVRGKVAAGGRGGAAGVALEGGTLEDAESALVEEEREGSRGGTGGEGVDSGVLSCGAKASEAGVLVVADGEQVKDGGVGKLTGSSKGESDDALILEGSFNAACSFAGKECSSKMTCRER